MHAEYGERLNFHYRGVIRIAWRHVVMHRSPILNVLVSIAVVVCILGIRKAPKRICKETDDEAKLVPPRGSIANHFLRPDKRHDPTLRRRLVRVRRRG